MEIDGVLATFAANGLSSESTEFLRGKLVKAGILLGAAQIDRARQEVDELCALQRRGLMSPIDSGRTFDLLAAIQSASGDPEGARISHETARREFLKQLPPEHPYLVRNAASREAVARLAP